MCVQNISYKGTFCYVKVHTYLKIKCGNCAIQIMSDQEIFNKYENLFWLVHETFCFLALFSVFRYLVAMQPSCLFRAKDCVRGLMHFITCPQKIASHYYCIYRLRLPSLGSVAT